MQSVSPNSKLYTSGEHFSLFGSGFSRDDQIVLFGSPPRPIEKIPVKDPNLDLNNIEITSIHIQNSHAYAIEDFSILHILDIRIPDDPRLIGSLTDKRFIKLKKIQATERFLYLADSGYGIWVVDISDPNQPSLVGNGATGFSFPAQSTFGLYVREEIIFSTNWNTGLQILEQLPNGGIQALGSIEVADTPYDVCVKGDYAYIATGITVQIIDLTDPNKTTNLIDPNDPNNNIPGESSNIQRLLMKDNLLYIGDRFYGIHIADLSIPTVPQIISSLKIEEEIKDIYLCDPYALIANGFDGLQIVDLHDKENPTIFGNIHTFGNATDISSYTNYIYVANGKKGLSIVEAPSLIPTNLPSFIHPNLQSYINTEDNIWAITAKDDYAYISNGRSGLKVIQTYPSWSPKDISTIQTEQETTYSFVKGDMLYLADSAILRAYDINDILLNPYLTFQDNKGSYKAIDPIMSIFVKGEYAYLADLGFGVQRVNTASFDLSGYEFSVNENGLAYDIVLDPNENIAYLANGEGGLWIVDFQDPFDPETLSELSQFGYAHNLKKYDNLIYMTNGSYGIEIIDVSSTSNPQHINSIDYNDFLKEVDIGFPFLYTAGDLQGIWINHLSENGVVTPIDVPINLPFGASAVKSDGDLLYCGDDYGNFYIFTAPVQALISDPVTDNRIIFKVNQDLPPGSYDIFLIRSGEVYKLDRALNVCQNKVTFYPGLNIFSYPGFEPFQNVKAFPLLINLEKQGEGSNLQINKIMWMKKTDSESELAYMDQQNQSAGENFDILPLRGYPVYAEGTEKKEYFLAGDPLKMTGPELIARLKSEITPGRNLVSLPLMEDGPIKSSDLINSESQPAVSSVREWDATQGKWHSGYNFFNTVNGKVKNLIGGHSYLISVP